MTKSEIAAKVEWEGGLAETILGYGLSWTELPADAPNEIKAAWLHVQGVRADVERIENWLEDE